MKEARAVTAEVLTIGDELNRGEIVDTNSSFLAAQLTELGFYVRWRTSVTDETQDMIDALERACKRADVVVTSGGLGPTDDDRTVDVVSQLVGAAPKVEPAHEARLKARVAERGETLASTTLRQIRIPDGADVLANPTGFAPGFTVRFHDASLSCMPGVPREMRPMFTQSLAPSLARRAHSLQTERRAFRVFGLGESKVDASLVGLLTQTENVTLHYRLAFPEVVVTLVVRRDTTDAARAELDRLSAEVERRLGTHVYSRDEETMERLIGRVLQERGEMLAVAESCTGGMLGAIVTEVPGSSRWFRGGVIAYDNAVKVEQLGVDATVIARDGAVSESVAQAMADGVRRRLHADWALSITGIAGPDGGTADKPVGTVWLGVAGPDGPTAQKMFWPGEREQVRRRAAITALDLLRQRLR